MNFKGELVMELYVHCDPALEIGDMFDGKKVIPIVMVKLRGPYGGSVAWRWTGM